MIIDSSKDSAELCVIFRRDLEKAQSDIDRLKHGLNNIAEIVGTVAIQPSSNTDFDRLRHIQKELNTLGWMID